MIFFFFFNIKNQLSYGHNSDVFGVGKIKTTQVFLFNVVQEIVIDRKCWSLAFKLKYDHSVIVSSSEKAECGMRGDDPVTIVLTSESVQTRSF